LSTAIRFEHVSKRFTLHHQRPRSFQDLVIELFKRNGENRQQPCGTVEAADGERREAFWALRDVSFTVEQGEMLGIIGSNGAGKSTVLKLISRIIEPTSGDIEVNGRIGALLELGAGFHPDLSGRENIYLNGSILGLNRHEIDCRLDQIIDFAELERFIDMPVKHYSSGMRMRLGFSIASHIDPQILLIDEVLAVGDENFQHKCLDHIMEMRRRGITICFVSHGLGQVRRLCSRAIWLNAGTIQAEGEVNNVVSAYLRYAAEEEESDMRRAIALIGETGRAKGVKTDETGGDAEGERERLEIVDASFLDAAGGGGHVFQVGEPWVVRFRCRSNQRVESPVFRLAIHRNDGLYVSDLDTQSAGMDVPAVEGEGDVLYRVSELPLLEGTYSVSASISSQASGVTYDERDHIAAFKVRQMGRGEQYGLVSLGGAWDWKDREADLSLGTSFKDADTLDRDTGVGNGDERRWGTGDIEVVGVSFLDAAGLQRRVFEAGEPWVAQLRYRARKRIEEPTFGLAVHREDGVHICGPNTHFGGLDIPFIEGRGEVHYRVDRLPLMSGRYYLSVSVHNRADTVMYDYHDRLYAFEVCQFDPGRSDAVVMLGGRWEWRGEC